MSIKITYFTHGTTTDNENKVATGWLPGELSERGIEQMKNLGSFITNKHFDVVFCSDLKRAVDSAEIMFGDHVQIIKDSRLRECNYGDNNGTKKKFREKDASYFIYNKFPNGESFKDVEKRVKEFVDTFKENYKDKNIAIVSHCYPQLSLEVLLKNKTWEQAIDEDWRNTDSWQPGWPYEIN